MNLNKKNKSYKNASGMTLIEVIIAIALIGIIVMGSIQAFALATRTNQQNLIHLSATNLLNKEMESIRSLDFSEIGTIGGNPNGALLPEQTINLGNRVYTLITQVNWIDEGGCGPSVTGNIGSSWDYKEIILTVKYTNILASNDVFAEKSIASNFSRDSEQPPIPGANIRICVQRGWNSHSEYVPVSGVRGIARKNGNEITANSNLRGGINILNIDSGDYTIDINPSIVGRILHPESGFPKNITLQNLSTWTDTVIVEYPVTLRVGMKDFFTGDFLSPKALSKIQLSQPYGPELSHDFSVTDSLGLISLPLDWSRLWPVGSGYSGKYSISNFNSPGYILSKIVDETNNPWDGTFIAPNTIKTVYAMLIEIPNIPPGTNENSDTGSLSWTNGQSHTITQDKPSNNGISGIETDEGKVMTAYQFSTGNNSNAIKLSKGSDWFNATKFFFTNNLLEISQNATLRLRANQIVFNGSIEISINDSSIEFRVLGKDIYGEYIIKPEDSDRITKGEAIGGINGKYYGEVYFFKDVYKQDKGNTKMRIIQSGAYYFPEGFDLQRDYHKGPSEGGLIRIE